MRTLKAFAVVFFVCGVIIFGLNGYFSGRQSGALWLSADYDEVTVSVKDDRSAWRAGLRAGVGNDESLTDCIRLTHIGNIDAEGRLKATYSVTDGKGHTRSLVRTVRFSDYTPPVYLLLQTPELAMGSAFVLSDLIMVADPLEGDITHMAEIVNSDLDMSKVGEYSVELTVVNSYGVSSDYTLTVTVI